MTGKEILEKYLEFIWNSFEYDMEVMSQGWMYYWCLVPIIVYTVFFLFKWIIIFAPITIPLRAVIKGFGYKKIVKKIKKRE